MTEYKTLNCQIRFSVEGSPEADITMLMPADKAGPFLDRVAELALSESINFLKPNTNGTLADQHTD